MAGNDGSLYKSTPDKRGVYTWKKAEKSNRNAPKTLKKTKGAKRYQIHDNGGRPFTLEDIPSKKTVILYQNIQDPEDYNKIKSTKELKRMKYKSIYVGDPKSRQFGDYEKGSSVVVQTAANEYYYIGGSIIKFSLAQGDDVVTFMNPVGNNDVPYPAIIGTKNIYFLIKQRMLPVSMVDITKDPYDQLAGINEFKDNGLEKKATEMKFKVLF